MEEPLKPDPKRQAVAALEGYLYQLWQSLYAWCRLQAGEDLYLEGAEDFDILRPGAAEATQVKKASRSLTLESEATLKALNDWWATRQRNPDRRVYLSFLTTAEIGLEKQGPFGTVPGLEYWELAKRTGTDLAPLRAFLTGHASLVQDLRGFVAGLSDADLRHEVLSRISWHAAAPSRTEVRDLVTDAVIELTERYFVPPSEARSAVVSRLYNRVCDVVLDPNRKPLTRADLLEAVEEMAIEQVPRAELIALRAASLTLGAGAGREGSAEGLVVDSTELLPLDGVLPSGFAPRAELVCYV